MSAPASDLRIHFDYWEPALAAALSPNVAYLRGEVPGIDGNEGKTPRIYAVLDLRRRVFTPTALDDGPDVSGWSLSVFCVGKSVREAAWALNRVTSTYEHAVVTLGAYTSTPIRVEPGAAISSKSGVASGSVTLNYTL